jgi:hypothetical protein
MYIQGKAWCSLLKLKAKVFTGTILKTGSMCPWVDWSISPSWLNWIEVSLLREATYSLLIHRTCLQHPRLKAIYKLQVHNSLSNPVKSKFMVLQWTLSKSTQTRIISSPIMDRVQWEVSQRIRVLSQMKQLDSQFTLQQVELNRISWSVCMCPPSQLTIGTQPIACSLWRNSKCTKWRQTQVKQHPYWNSLDNKNLIPF